MAPSTFLAVAITVLASVLCGRAIARLLRGSNTLARRYAKYAVGASAAFLPITLAAAVGQSMSSTGPESKAYCLARGIAAAMNAGVLTVPVGIASVIVWIVARHREAATKA